MTNKEKSIILFTNKIQEINDALKDLELGQLQFSLEEKCSRISATFVSLKGDNNIIGSLDDIFNKKEVDVLTWLSNQFNNRYLYKALHQYFGDRFSSISIDHPIGISLLVEDIDCFISQDISEEQKVVATIKGSILEMHENNGVSICVFASKTIQSSFETFGANMDALKAELELCAKKI